MTIIVQSGVLRSAVTGVTFYNKVFHADQGPGVPGFTFSFDAGSGSNRALLVGMIQVSGGLTTGSVTFDGVAMTEIGATDQFYGLVAPSAGTHDVVTVWGGGGNCSLYAIAVTGADQTGGTTTFHDYTGGSGTSTTCTVTVPSTTTSQIVVAHYLNSPFSTAFNSSSNGTDIGKHNTGGGGNSNAAHYATGTATNTVMSYGQDASVFYLSYGVAIKAA